MTEQRLEKLWNKAYYDYLEREEAQELIDYYKNIEQENKRLKEENKQLKIENSFYRSKVLGGNNQVEKLIEKLGDKE